MINAIETTCARSAPPHARPRGARRRAAFTLLELLVVIAIIALLVGIMVPVLARAKEAARNSGCQTSLKQLGVLANNFAAENNDRYPGTNVGFGDHTALYSKVGGIPWNSDMWFCPSEQASVHWANNTSSYGYNWQYFLQSGPDYPHLQWSGFANPGIRPSTVRNTTKAMVYVEHKAVTANRWTYINRPGDGADMDGHGRVAFRHGEKANAVYADAHAGTAADGIDLASSELEHWDPR